MKFYSINRKSPAVSLREAVMGGLAPDGGLYMPERIPVIPAAFFNNIAGMSVRDIAFVVADLLLGNDIEASEIKEIVNSTFTFDMPLREVDTDIYSLELYHGPTRAFKDVGARFLARIISHYSSKSKVKVLVATSGDSGGAVAAGFKDVYGVEVYILYPSGRLSRDQREHLDSGGGNVHPIEVLGNFDDCQKLVKQTIADESLRRKFELTSANSVNICRLLPQTFYYFHAYGQLAWMRGAVPENVVMAIPSGNLGNLTAGLLAWRMGLPVKRFALANNVNNVTANYLSTGKFVTKKAQKTLASAMDVGNPSNISRILEIFGGDYGPLSKLVNGYSYGDDEIKATMADVHSKSGYLVDPHGATALAALKDDLKAGETGIFLETASPTKYPRAVREATGVDLVTDELNHQAASSHRSSHPRISVSPEALKKILLSEGTIR